ncbi:MAG: hypothetical protein ACLPSW_33640 [Roseiarcus sp.]
MSSQTPDLFGFKPAQGDLFADEPARNDGVGVADPEEVRARLHKLLAEARAAQSRSPWNERTTRMHQIVFPQMANWLPAAEAEQLRFEFERELRRLTNAA